MIDTIYKVLLTIINKENQGYISPEEFNLIAINVQNEIFSEYFKDANPCRTTVEINALPSPIAIELKCIATI